MKTILILLFCLGTFSFNLFAQCDQKLLENARKLVHDNEIVINEFKIKLKTASINEPVPVAKFSQKLEKGKLYRMRILSNQDEFSSTGILRIFENNKFLGTTYSEKVNKHFESFDFKSQKTGNYKLLITFQDGQAGCAVVIVSKVK